MKRIAFLLPILCYSLLIHAQILNHVQGEILVQLEPESSPRFLINAFREFEGRQTNIQLGKRVSRPLNIWSFSFDFVAINEIRFLEAVSRHRTVAIAQFNHFVSMRSTVPDDPQFPDQWQYINTGQSGGAEGADIDIDLAWDVATGGLTPDGDTIVVAVLDDGIDLNHDDFEDNLWVNYQEIPANGIDDDGNGYVDDYRGWSIATNNDNISGGGHGTPVAGIVGAKGNNGIGVAGVNWNVKVMVIKNNFNTNEASVLEAYSYPLIMRQRYNASNGAEGAFVVSTNASWGIDFGDPEDAPLWCAFYDTLGVHGIISCGATINGNVNVDEEGDLPTGCSSDYLITVTNMNHNDQKVTGAGYGIVTIDLGAFGANTWTTANGNGYGGFGGTSGATPHVTGTVGLLYSAPCPALIALAKSDPGAAALLVKEYILAGTDPNESLEGITLTGGRLNVSNSMQLLMTNCGPCPPPSSLFASEIIDTSARLSWNVNDSIFLVDLRWRAIGDTVWNTLNEVNSPLQLTGLVGCTDYEYQLKAFCNSDTIDYTSSYLFKTDGCCEAPAALSVDNITNNSAQVIWESVLAAQSYDLRIRESGSDEWVVFNTAQPGYALTGLEICTNYELQIQTVCDTSSTGFGETFLFLTAGCGPCLDLEYCVPSNLSTSDEWISSVLIQGGILSNTSGDDGGYGDYAGFPFPQIEQGASYNFLLQPGFAANSFTEDWRIWIDFDQDGAFEGPEVVFDSNPSSGAVLGSFAIPPDAPLGNTRMRILMQFQNAGPACPFIDSFGEAEDYCMEIVPTSDCHFPFEMEGWNFTDTSAQFGWEDVGPAVSYLFRYKKMSEPEWTEATVLTAGLVLYELEQCETYEAQVRTVCAADFSEYSESFVFDTQCINALPETSRPEAELRVFPNPFRDAVRLEWALPESSNQLQVEWMDAYGRLIRQLELDGQAERQGTVHLSSMGLPAGVYLLRLKADGNVVAVQKVVSY